MTVATVARTEPTRHRLVIPDCDCGMCAPTWARRRGKSKRFTEPVTLWMRWKPQIPPAGQPWWNNTGSAYRP